MLRQRSQAWARCRLKYHALGRTLSLPDPINSPVQLLSTSQSAKLLHSCFSMDSNIKSPVNPVRVVRWPIHASQNLGVGTVIPNTALVS